MFNTYSMDSNGLSDWSAVEGMGETNTRSLHYISPNLCSRDLVGPRPQCRDDVNDVLLCLWEQQEWTVWKVQIFDMIDDQWWWLMTADDGRWWLMIVNGGKWWKEPQPSTPTPDMVVQPGNSSISTICQHQLDLKWRLIANRTIMGRVRPHIFTLVQFSTIEH